MNFGWPPSPEITTAELRLAIGYRQPPIELPPYWVMSDPKPWLELRDWFEAEGIDVRAGTEVYLAERFGLDLDEASDWIWRYKQRCR